MRSDSKHDGLETIRLDLRRYREFRLAPARKEKSPSVPINAEAFNVLNRVNYQNYIGSFFGQAVATLPARRVQLGMQFQF